MTSPAPTNTPEGMMNGLHARVLIGHNEVINNNIHLNILEPPIVISPVNPNGALPLWSWAWLSNSHHGNATTICET